MNHNKDPVVKAQVQHEYLLNIFSHFRGFFFNKFKSKANINNVLFAKIVFCCAYNLKKSPIFPTVMA